MFNNNADIYYNFLSQLPDSDLEHLCAIDQFTFRQCQKKELWVVKILYVYPDFPPSVLRLLDTKEVRKMYYDLKFQHWVNLLDLAYFLIDEGNEELYDWLRELEEYREYVLLEETPPLEDCDD